MDVNYAQTQLKNITIAQNARFRRVFALSTALIVLAVSLFIPAAASAATWPLPASQPSPALAFHETYEAGGGSYVHSGIDIAGSAGQTVAAPVAGVVSFVGSVPSGDSALGNAAAPETMRAVSVRMPDGRTVTLMPFASVVVSKGQSVSEGEGLGSLAAQGDRSAAATHLHMGLKRGGVYYDPMTLFGAAPAAAPVAAGQPASAGAPAVAAAAPAASPALELAAEPASEPEPQEQLGTISSGAIAWQPAAEPAASPLAGVEAAVESIVDACRIQARSFVDGLEELASLTGIPVAALALAALALAAVIVAGAAYAFARRGVPALARLWHGRNSFLYKADVGDSMHKLFPAPGTPSRPGAV